MNPLAMISISEKFLNWKFAPLLLFFGLCMNAYGQDKWSGADDLTGNISRSGNVGIGVNNPANPLQIESSISEVNVLVKNTGANPTRTYLSTFSGKSSIQTDKDFTIRTLISSSWGDRFIVTNAGNVGIGTTTAGLDHRLQIKDSPFGNHIKFERGTGTARIFQDNNANNLYLDAAAGLLLNAIGGGNVGIGTSAPSYKLTVKSNSEDHLRLDTDTETAIIKLNNDGNMVLWAHGYDDIVFRHGFGTGTESLRITSPGFVGIGTDVPDERLTVKGKIHTSEVRVDLESEVAPDYVFDKDYELATLSEIELYIKQNKHLPEVPSAKEMEAQGLNLKQMNLLLLKKVEELTLHLIAMKKEIDELKKK